MRNSYFSKFFLSSVNDRKQYGRKWENYLHGGVAAYEVKSSFFFFNTSLGSSFKWTVSQSPSLREGFGETKSGVD